MRKPLLRTSSPGSKSAARAISRSRPPHPSDPTSASLSGVARIQPRSPPRFGAKLPANRLKFPPAIAASNTASTSSVPTVTPTRSFAKSRFPSGNAQRLVTLYRFCSSHRIRTDEWIKPSPNTHSLKKWPNRAACVTFPRSVGKIGMGRFRQFGLPGGHCPTEVVSILTAFLCRNTINGLVRGGTNNPWRLPDVPSCYPFDRLA